MSGHGRVTCQERHHDTIGGMGDIVDGWWDVRSAWEFSQGAAKGKGKAPHSCAHSQSGSLQS